MGLFVIVFTVGKISVTTIVKIRNVFFFLGNSFLDNTDIQVKIADLGNACYVVSEMH